MNSGKINDTNNSDNPLGKSYWNERWQTHQTGWDIGYASPAITEYMAQYPNKNAAILIPGCGNAWEAEWLAANGFTNITLLDIAPAAASQLDNKFAGNNAIKVICADFFSHEGEYDLIIEQTFFCAIPPSKRKQYAEKAASLLNEGGKIIGLLFDKEFEKEGPPFGGTSSEYKEIVGPYFDIKTMSACTNSIDSRAGSELFIRLEKRA